MDTTELFGSEDHKDVYNCEANFYLVSHDGQIEIAFLSKCSREIGGRKERKQQPGVLNSKHHPCLHTLFYISELRFSVCRFRM